MGSSTLRHAKARPSRAGGGGIIKLWIDAQLSPALAKWITENFANIEATAVRELGLRNADDPVIFFSAREAEAVVITKDSDFLELQKRHGPRPKIIWITCGNTSNTALKSILAGN